MPLMDQSNSDLNACQKLSQKLGENITKCQNNIYVRKKYLWRQNCYFFVIESLSRNFVKDLVELQ